MKLSLTSSRPLLCYDFEVLHLYQTNHHIALPGDKYLSDKAYEKLEQASGFKVSGKSNVFILLPGEYFELLKDYNWIVCCNERNETVILLDDISPDDAIMLKLKWE